MTTIKYAVYAAMLLANTAWAAQPVAADAYVLARTVELGAVSKWDYLDVDQQRHRLFLSRGDRVQVLELPVLKPLADIPGTAGVHGIAFAQDLKLGFTSNGKANSVTVFDLDTLAVKQEIGIPGINPDAILYDEASKKLYTFNGKSMDATVIDATTLQVVASIKLSGKPEFAVSDGQGRVFVNIEDRAEVAVIAVADNAVFAKWPLAGCEEPTGIALDKAHERLFSVCQNEVMQVTDSKNGKQVASVKIGKRPDAALYDADTATVFASNGAGSLSVIRQADADHYAAKEIATRKGARTMAIDNATKALYLPVADGKKLMLLEMKPVK